VEEVKSCDFRVFVFLYFCVFVFWNWELRFGIWDTWSQDIGRVVTLDWIV
jgi:hypothetical protein